MYVNIQSNQIIQTRLYSTEMKIHCCEGNINLLREEYIHLIFTSSRHKFCNIISVYLVF